jgi:enamine deaminase RidA (YjgF/YER057c/UK114 family)
MVTRTWPKSPARCAGCSSPGRAARSAGASPSDVVKLTVLIVDHSEARLHTFGAELAAAFGSEHRPTCTLIPVPRLALDGMLFEIEALAAVPVA